MNGEIHPVVLITGASSGIGRAGAEHLARQGYRVFGTSRRESSPPEKEAEADTPEMIRMDVTDEESVNQGVALVLKRAGRIDAVVNNAGIGYAGAVEDTSIEEARAQFETNFFGVLRVCRAVLPTMRLQQSGHLITISSIGGRIGLPFQGLYSATKFALEGMMEALSMEVRSFGIHAVLVAPGDFQTRFTANRLKTIISREDPVYAERFRRAMEVIEHEEQNGPPPDAVARLLEKIIKNPSPRLRYTVGHPVQKLSLGVKKVVPGRLFERIMMGFYKVR